MAAWRSQIPLPLPLVDIYLEYRSMVESEVSKVRPISAYPGKT